ncbi:MAG TPA: hypothetical protein VLL08_05075 [Kineosporiaceae bacterium]|nr:hypothetical protein [Kineosporiaceae bacterium]
MNSQDFPAYMRVTSGLGAVTTDVSPPVAAGRPSYLSAPQTGPRPLPGPGRWTGTAASLRRTTDYPGAEEDEVTWPQDDRQQMLRSMADREADHHGYRGTRQWSDRETSDRNRSGPWAGHPGGPVGPVGPIPRGPGGFAGPRRGLSGLPTDAVGHAPATMPRGMPVLDDSDPTPLYTATEYVAVGDSPLYQVVAELIAVGDGGQSGAGAPVDPMPMEVVGSAGYPEVAGGAGPAEASELNWEDLERPIRRRRTDRASAAVSPGSFLSTAPPLPTAVSLPTASIPTVTPLPTVSIPIATPLPAVPPRSSDLDSFEVQGPYSEGGKHRDELRLAGHRSAFDDGRRSPRRSPRHRTV